MQLNEVFSTIEEGPKPQIEQLRNILAGRQAGPIKFSDGTMRVDMYSASAVVQVYDAVSSETQQKIDGMLATKLGFMKLADFADGTYYITSFLYKNANLPSVDLSFPFIAIPQFDIPITVDYSRAGAFNGVYTQEAENFFNSNTAQNTENYLITVDISTVNGARKFSVENSVGTVSGMGRMANQFNHIRTKK